MHNIAIRCVGHDDFEAVFVRKTSFIKLLFHGESGSQQADCVNTFLQEHFRRGIGNMQ